MAASIHRLAYAGRKVRWAPEPLLLAGIVFTVIVSVWLEQWHARNLTEITTGRMLLQVLKMMAIYIAAASVSPDPRDGEGSDLYAYYDSTLYLTYGALIVGLLLFRVYYLTDGRAIPWSIGLVFEALLYPVLYLSLIFIRWRPYNIALLTFGLGFRLWQIAGQRIAGS